MLNNFNFSKAIHWWVNGLGYLIPPSLRKILSVSSESITIEFRDKTVFLKHLTDDSDEALEIRHFDINDDIEKTSALNWLNEKHKNKAQIVFILPNEFFLRKKISFPKAASSNLRQILGFEMNRKTPFSPEQVYFDYLLDEHNEQADQVTLELFLVPRNKVDSELELLSSWNIQLYAIRPAEHHNSQDINLIEPEKRLQSNNKSDKTLLALATTACILFMLLLYAPLITQKKELSLLEAEVTKNRKTAIQLQELRKKKEKILEQSHFLENKRTTEMSSIRLMNEITHILPDDTWLTRFVMKSGELQLQGESSNASSLIQILESSDYLTNVQFRSPVTQNKLSNKDKFHLSADFSQEDV